MYLITKIRLIDRCHEPVKCERAIIMRARLLRSLEDISGLPTFFKSK